MSVSISDLRMQLSFDVNSQEFMSKLRNINDMMSTSLDSHVVAYQTKMNDLMAKRNAIESKFFTPEEKRQVAVEALLETQRELQLSDRAYYGLMKQIEAQYEKEAGVTARTAAAVEDAEKRKQAAIRATADAQRIAQQQYDGYMKENQRLEDLTVTPGQRFAHGMADLRQRKSSGMISPEAFTAGAKELVSEYNSAVPAAQRLLSLAERTLLTRTQESEAIQNIIRGQQKAIEVAQAYADKATRTLAARDENVAEQKRTASEVIQNTIRQQQQRKLYEAAVQNKAYGYLDSVDEEDRKRMQQQQTDLDKLNKSRQTMHRIRQQQAAITARAEREHNAEVQHAINLLRSLETEEQRLIRIQTELNAALQQGTINQQQYDQSMANIVERQRHMIGGAGRMGYVVGNVATGFEDFITVMSITGFNMDSLSMGFRAASNNIGQAIRGLNTANAALYGSMFSIGTIALGFAIPAMYKHVMGLINQKSATDSLTDSIKRYTDTLQASNRAEERRGSNVTRMQEIDEMFDSEDVIKETEKAANEYANAVMRMDDANKAFEAQFQRVWDDINKDLNFEDLFATLNKVSNGMGDVFAEDFKKMEATFNQEMRFQGPAQALRNLEKEMSDLTEAMLLKLSQLGGKEWSGKFLNLLDDAAPVDAIQSLLADTNILSELANSNTANQEEYTKALQDAEDLMQSMIALQEQLNDALDKEAEIRSEQIYQNMVANEEKLQELKEKAKRDSMGGASKEAERELFDLAMQRRDLLESGIAGPQALEDLFNQQLQGREADLMEQLQSKEPSTSASLGSEVSAMISANKQIVESIAKPEDTARREMVELLRGIRDHLAGNRILLEVVQ